MKLPINYSKIVSRKKDFLVWILCAIVWLFGSLYYYGLQRSYIPNSEDLSAIWGTYKALKLGEEFHLTELLSRGVAVMATVIGGGMNYRSMRLYFAIMNAVVLALAMYLSICKRKDKGMDITQLPLFALFMIFLHPVTATDRYGLITDYGTDFFYQYPYNYHFLERIYTLVCFIVVTWLLTAKSVKKKRICVAILVMLGCYILSFASRNTMMYILLLFPCCIVFFLRAFHDHKKRRYALMFLCICMGLIVVTKVIPTPLRSALWTSEQASTYGVVYGGSNWISLDMVITAFINYVIKISECFNILLSSAPVISLYTVIYAIKLCLLLAGYVIVFVIVKGSIVGKQKWKSVDIVDEMLAWSYIALSVAHVFTEYGLNVMYSQRYIVPVVSIMAILLCRHLMSVLEDIRWISAEMIKKDKRVVCFISMVCCLCYMKPVWTYMPMDHCHMEDMHAAIAYIKDTDYGCAVAPDYLAKAITATCNGEIFVYGSIGEARELQGDDAKIAYMITRYDYDYGKYHQYMYYENFSSYEDLCSRYSVPTRIIDYDTFSLCIWEDGMQIRD